MKITCQSFISLMQSRRTVFNERFNMARRIYPDLDAAAFTYFLTDILDPLVTQAERIDPGSLPSFVDAAYLIGLELTGKKFIGPGARSSVHDTLWKMIFPSIITLLLKEPGSIMSKLSNAADQIEAELHAGVDDWLLSIEQNGPLCQDIDSLLSMVQVSAWKCGMAHYRNTAIPLLTKIPSRCCNTLFGAADNVDWQQEITKLQADPWYSPAINIKKPRIPVRLQAGGFRGFGGPFIRPPVAVDYEGNKLLWCDNEWWVVHADIFGVTCKRLLKDQSLNIPEPTMTITNGQRVLKSGVILDKNKVTIEGHTFTFSPDDLISGAAFVSNTLVVSFDDSHIVQILEVRTS
jgi:hypothetical protein